MSTTSIIRQLQSDEIPEMQRLRRDALESEPLAFGATVEDDPALDSAFVARSISDPSSAAIFVAFVSGTAVGMAGVVRQTRQKIRHRAQIWGMFVQPPSRGRGIGSALLDAATRHARSWSGVLQLDLSVTSSALAAIHLYERVGFRAWGSEPRALGWNGTYVDEHHLVLALSPKTP